MRFPILKKQERKALTNGAVAVLPTDTLYGLVGQALCPATVERIYELRRRDPGKPLIVLIPDLLELKKFGITLSKGEVALLNRYWPGPLSVILPCPHPELAYLHRGTGTLAVRMPAVFELRKLMKETGPLVAPSANTQGEPSAQTIEEAREYFGNGVAFYADGGKLMGEPSTLAVLENGRLQVIRQGGLTLANV